jgi:electron transport complex protein RnfE
VPTHTLRASLSDALGMGIGFTWGLFLLGSIREIFGEGTLLAGTPLKLQIMPQVYNPLIVMILPAGAFLVLGILVALMNRIER